MSGVSRNSKDAAGRRDAILNATLEIIEESGIDKVRGADVAKRVGVSVGLIFYHFDNLGTLIASAVEYAANRDVKALDEVLAGADPDPETRLRAVLREYGPTGSAFGWRLWVESWSASLRDDQLRKLVAALDSGWREAIVGIIEDGVARGAFTCADPAGTAWRLTAMLDGLAVQHVVFDGAISIAQIDDWVALTASRELGLPVE
ncbi:MAG: TetR/AcrR family transcriptional regulator [Gordonia sp. (in: high G+C Gram-positive bacteria)]|uniref:TetR/AcrR family transcriptional regulator n=1 Tax=Gordonia TaxID=2053 RepID=UPI003263DCF1